MNESEEFKLLDVYASFAEGGILINKGLLVQAFFAEYNK